MGLAAREAVRRHQEPCFLVMYEVGFPQQPDHFLDITKQLPKKQEALRYLCPHSDRSESAEVVMALNKIRGYTMGNGIEVAEAFKVVQVNELLNTPCKINICAEDIPNNKLAGSLVSIIIRTTNRVELADALSSVATQTYRHIEVILVDVEGRGELPESGWCGQFPVRIASTGSHLDRGSACNVGLNAASGDYVAFLDDDDWLLPDHVASLVAVLQASPDDKVAYTGVICRGEMGDGRWETIRTYNDPYDPTRLLLENYLPMHSVMFARSLLENGLCFDESLVVYEDWDFWIELSLCTNFIHVNRVTAVYRISRTSGSAVRDGEESALRGLQALLEKWRPRWSLDQLTAISLYPNLQLRLARAAAEQERNEAELGRAKAEQERAKAEKELIRSKRKLMRIDNERKASERGLGAYEKEWFQAQFKLRVIEEAVTEINKGIAKRDAKINELAETNATLYFKIAELQREAQKAQEAKGKLKEQQSLINELTVTNATLYFKNAELQREAQASKDKLKEQQSLYASLGITLKMTRQNASRLTHLIASLGTRLTVIQDSPAWPLTRAVHLLVERFLGPANALIKVLKYTWWLGTLSLTSKKAERRIEDQILG